MTRIGLIGRIDPHGTMIDGQSVKTRTVHREMINQLGDASILSVDTTSYARRWLSVTLRFIQCVLTCETIVVLLSRGGRRALFPLLYVAVRLRRTRVYHSLIGGALVQDLEESPQLLTYLNAFEINWVESEELAAELRTLGVRNAYYLPNAKEVAEITPAELRDYDAPPHRFCTLSRVTREKGIPDAATAIRMLNAKGIAATLDVIGPVEEDFGREFFAILDENPYVRYLGVVPPENAATILNGYCAIVFPTRWRGEGVPGSIIDALAAGVPIVSYRWRFHDEMLTEGITGFSTSPGNVAGLATLLERLTAQTRTERSLMRLNCLARARDYAPDVIVARMLEYMNLPGERP